jgi:hypothetical protein
MSSKLSNAIILSAVAILLIACAPVPIQTVENAPINASSANYDLSDVTNAIQQAGVGLGWQMKEETPGHIVGTLNVRRHVAVVDITYTLDEFSISYKDSTNLKYNAGTNSIHSSYGKWVGKLTKAIDARLVSI